jgi:hypothetical protein
VLNELLCQPGRRFVIHGTEELIINVRQLSFLLCWRSLLTTISVNMHKYLIFMLSLDLSDRRHKLIFLKKSNNYFILSWMKINFI